ncbi:MAG: diguanylate cyclase [Oscillospiraceae bacterium]|nr:diguanylate cyclase [Oscillospiraceae bacterium]
MKTILVVDDNELNLSTAEKILSDKYKVVPVMNGQQALTYLENGECDIILLDINMPDMDGFEALRRIRAIGQYAGIPVIFLTEDINAETEMGCFNEEAADFIAKPFVPHVMLSRISRILELEDLRHSLMNMLEEKTREVWDIKSKARQDVLTELWNRAHTEEMVNSLIEAGTHGALMMIDIDNFKSINDNYGHIAGDRTLKMFADTLRKFSADGDVLCRIGGDEFIVFVKDVTSKEELSKRASDMISDICNKIKESEFETNNSISIGIAQTPEDGTEFTKLYNSADKALYYVKQNGKNSYHFFSDKIQAENSRSGRTVDLKYLQDLMSRADTGSGAYQLDFESFHHVYNFIRRFIDRSNNDVQTVLFTVSENPDAELDAAETEFALELLEKAIYTSLRRSDVSTRYSSKQLIVILMDANNENGDKVAERIMENFNKLYTGGKIHIDYGIARMDSGGIIGKNKKD